MKEAVCIGQLEYDVQINRGRKDILLLQTGQSIVVLEIALTSIH